MQLNKLVTQQSIWQYEKQFIMRDELKLVLHAWLPNEPKAVLFYVNGVQSHAKWLAPIAEYFAAQAIAIFVFDRRGHGESEGLRGDIASAEQLLEDYYEALSQVKAYAAHLPLTLFGQSMGGSILAALLAHPEFDIHVNNIVFSASALGQRKQNLSSEAYEQMLSLNGLNYVDIGLRDEDYADNEHDLKFMQQDPLLIKQMTERSKAAILSLENIYLDKENSLSKVPSCYVHPMVDPIVNITSAKNIFMQLTNQQGMIFELPSNKHYLWFTKSRILLTNWLKSYILSQGFMR